MMVKELNRVKANLSDLVNVTNHIENLNDRLKQVAILQQEFVKIFKPIHDSVSQFDMETKK